MILTIHALLLLTAFGLTLFCLIKKNYDVLAVAMLLMIIDLAIQILPK